MNVARFSFPALARPTPITVVGSGEHGTLYGVSAGRHAGGTRTAGRARVRMLRRRRRAAVVAVLLLGTLGWVWHAAQASPQDGSTAGTTVAPELPGASPPSRTPNAGAPASASPSPVAATPAAVSRPTGRLVVVPGNGPVRGSGPLRRYLVEVEQGLATNPSDFAAAVERTLADPRSWGRRGVLSFQRVSSGPVAFRVLLASPRTVDRYCAPLNTNSYTSCFMSGRAVINFERWERAVPWYADDLATYRQYVINHEVGHALGRGHVNCPASGAVAPVMQQQTLSMQGCRRNAWPYP